MWKQRGHQKQNNLKSFQMLRGARQGSVLCPMLFNKVMDKMIRRITEGQVCHTKNGAHR
jgi:hypothetical protein